MQHPDRQAYITFLFLLGLRTYAILTVGRARRWRALKKHRCSGGTT